MLGKVAWDIGGGGETGENGGGGGGWGKRRKTGGKGGKGGGVKEVECLAQVGRFSCISIAFSCTYHVPCPFFCCPLSEIDMSNFHAHEGILYVCIHYLVTENLAAS